MAYTSPAKILIVDDERRNVQVFQMLMTSLGYEVMTADNGRAALDAVAHDLPDLILLDINMPGIDGLEVCRRLKSEERTRLIPIVLITGLSATEDRVRGIEAGADDFLTKPPAIEELQARVRSLVRLKRYTSELDSAESVILSLGLTIEARDRFTQGHCQRLATYATELGKRLGFSDDDLTALNRGGFLHDVGKVGIPDAVLMKPGRLTPEEFTLMRRHSAIGHEICGTLRLLDAVRPIVRHHHERPDGKGYPDGLAGDAIPPLARIMAVVDVFDALTTARPYKQPFARDEAFRTLRESAATGGHFPELVEEFIALAEASGFAAPVSDPPALPSA
jgi:putative two-component system response regulator